MATVGFNVTIDEVYDLKTLDELIGLLYDMRDHAEQHGITPAVTITAETYEHSLEHDS